MDRLSSYIAEASKRPLPPEVQEKTKHHLLDTIAAIVSGSRLKAGELATKFAREQGGTPEAQVIGSDLRTTAINAAMRNGYMAHADETDDSHAPSYTHPGCGIVPAALAMAERQNSSGEALLRSVALGYDVSSRVGRLMNTDLGRRRGHATHAIGPMFGSAAAASSLAGLSAAQIRHAIAYTAQQASGIKSWARDEEHVEKAFVFAGMTARNGVTSAVFVQMGFTGEDDIFAGDHNFLEVFSGEGDDLSQSVATLGDHYEVMLTNIKKFCVGSPIQASADAMTILVQTHSLKAAEVAEIEVHTTPRGAPVVDNRSMPDINCQYIISCILLDGRLTFKAAHDHERMSDPAVQAVRAQIRLIGDEMFADKELQRPGLVRVRLTNGQTVEQLVPAVRGTADNPMSRQEVEDKALDLLGDVIGQSRAQQLIAAVWDIEGVKSARDLQSLLAA
jgi:2-methylcitrate dehydratase PrpD